MPEMTLQEALQSEPVQGMINGLVEAAVQDALSGDVVKSAVQEAVAGLDLAGMIKSAVEPHVNSLREAVQAEVAKDRARNELRELHLEAVQRIEASTLKGAAKQNLMDDYALTESADGTLVPGRALALVEAQTDESGKVVKTAKAVLREQVDADIKRARNVLREAAPTVPSAPGGGSGETPAAVPASKPDWVTVMERDGLDPKTYGFRPEKAAA